MDEANKIKLASLQAIIKVWEENKITSDLAMGIMKGIIEIGDNPEFKKRIHSEITKAKIRKAQKKYWAKRKHKEKTRRIMNVVTDIK